MVLRRSMQQDTSSNGYQSNRRTNAPSDRIRCSMGEWKQRSQFSNKSLNSFDFMVLSGRGTAQNSPITCREHTSSGQRTEILCQGPCGRVRSANDFSKASKRNKKLWCKDCTDWQTADPEYNLPPPGTELSTDELGSSKKGDQSPESQDESQTSNSNDYSSAHSSSHDEDEDDETNDNETADSRSTAFSSDDEDDGLTSGYWSDGSNGSIATVHAGLGSCQQTAQSLGFLTTYTHAAQSQTASSVSQPEIDSDGLSTVATSTRATTNATYESVTTERVRSNGWGKVRKSKTFQAPDYIRHGGLPQGQESRRLRGEDSDDSF